MREIAKEIGVAKTSIRKALIAGGLDLRPCNRSLTYSRSKSEHHHIGVAPYGYFVQNGRLVEDSREQVVVRKIMKLWTEGQSLSAIARHINGLKIRPRKGKIWDHSIIRSIVNRQESIKQQTSGGKHGTR